MNHLDTFSGIGGWALAARWMGWNTLAFVEKEKFCHKVLNKNFPDVPIHNDIFTFSGKPFRGRVDILTGSTPCQPFSQAGKRKGSNDERHLFPEFLRVVAEVEPSWIVIENVYGLLSIESGQVFEDYHASLESEGYSVQTVCIPASALNAPHRRDRLWIVAHSNADNARIGASRSQSNANRRPVSVQRAQSQFEPCGHSGDVADPDLSGRIGRQKQGEIRERQSDQGRGNDRPFSEFAVNSSGVNQNPSGFRCDSQKPESKSDIGQQWQPGSRDGVRIPEWREPWIEVATRFCRVDDVVPNRVDRLKSLGNAIVPQIAYEIFKAIEEVENSVS